jgi:hypothetical protein
MSEPLWQMLSPEQRRRKAAEMLAAQYDRPTPQDTTVTERAGLLPMGTYANGMTGLAFPGFIADPVAGFVREIYNPVPYLDRSEDEKRKTVETGFDVAGAAMVGGLAAPKPTMGAAKQAVDLANSSSSPIAVRNRAINDAIEAGATGPETYRGFSGSETNRHFDTGFTRGPWASPSADVASTYANVSNGRPGNVAPMEFRFKNPTVIDAQGELWRDIPVGDGLTATTNMLANSARNAGHDGIVIRNVRDNLSFGGDPGDVYHALRPGTTYSALTGDLLYANGGRQGAAAGAALGGQRETLNAGYAKLKELRERQIAGDAAAGQSADELAKLLNQAQSKQVPTLTPDGLKLLRGVNMMYKEMADRLDPKSAEGIAARNGYERTLADINAASVPGVPAVRQRHGVGEIMSPDGETIPVNYAHLYANGGRPGAAAGAAVSSPNDPALNELLRQYGIELPKRQWSNAMLPGDA